MGNKMLAAVFYGPRDLRVEKVDIPEVGPNDVLLKVTAAGICGSDVHSYKLGLYINPGQIMGHEFCGEVVKVGSGVKDIEVGERGTGFAANFCGSCYWCKSEQYILCPSLFTSSTGYGLPGAFAEYIKISNAVIGASYHKVPDEIDDLSAAAIEPTGVAAYTVAACQPQQGDQVVILGGGLIGNAAMQILKSIPDVKVVLSEVSKVRLDAAKAMGADVVIDAANEVTLDRVKEIIGIGKYHFAEGAMADIVIESAGVPATVQDSFELVRSGGVIAFVGLPEEKAAINTTKIVHKSPRIMGCLGGDSVKAIEYLRNGIVNVKPLISHVFSLQEAKEAFETQSDANKSIKVMMKP